MSKKVEFESAMEKVNVVRKIIGLNVLSNDELNIVCHAMGLSDTAFHNKTPEQKLNDFLLDERYYRQKYHVPLDVPMKGKKDEKSHS